ncbi:MAG: succinate dehydrogenase, partial [Actinomycetota bacterium]|nr:succinate dehydrogenase [Actinomycetota bacterium]
MATTTEARPDPPLSSKPPSAGRDRPIRGFELWTWLFMRISGIVLLFLAVGHVLIMHVFDEGVDRVNFA